MDDQMEIMKDAVQELEMIDAGGDGEDGVVEMGMEAIEDAALQDTRWKKQEEEEEEEEEEVEAVGGCGPLRCLLAVFCIPLPRRRDSCAAYRLHLLPSRG